MKEKEERRWKRTGQREEGGGRKRERTGDTGGPMWKEEKVRAAGMSERKERARAHREARDHGAVPTLPLPRYHGCHGPGRQRYQCALRNAGRPLPPPSRFQTELARATGDGALPPGRDMKQLAQVPTLLRYRQVHPVPSIGNHNRYQAPSQVLPPIHHCACLPYPTS